MVFFCPEKNLNCKMDVEKFLSELETLEKLAPPTVVDKDPFNFDIAPLGVAGDSILIPPQDEPGFTTMPLGMGPFEKPDLNEEIKKRFFTPDQKLENILRKSQRYFKRFHELFCRYIDRQPNLESLYDFGNLLDIQTKFTFKRDYNTGKLDLNSYTVVITVHETHNLRVKKERLL